MTEYVHLSDDDAAILRDCRKRNGLTQKHVAEYVNIASNSVSSIENGYYRKLDIEKLMKLLMILPCDDVLDNTFHVETERSQSQYIPSPEPMLGRGLLTTYVFLNLYHYEKMLKVLGMPEDKLLTIISQLGEAQEKVSVRKMNDIYDEILDIIHRRLQSNSINTEKA